MNESSQQRLDEFRAGYRNARPAASGFVAWLQILVILVGFAGLVAILLLRGNPRLGLENGYTGLPPESQRQLAAYLAQKNALMPALDAYDVYLAQAELAPLDRAKVCFAAATVAIDAEAYEHALALLYQAEWLKPGDALQKEIDAKVMTCLEKLGRSAELRNELRERAQIGHAKNDVQAGDPVLAELGDRVFTQADLDQALDKLPPAAREAMADPARKSELLKNIVAEYLLTEKARRQQLDKDPEVQAMLSDQLNALMVRKLLQQEVQSKIAITPGDVETYYEKERSRFTTPPTITLRIGHRASGADETPTFDEKTVTLAKGRMPNGFVGGEEALNAAFALEPQARTEAFADTNGREVIYEVVSKTPEVTPPLGDIRKQVEADLRATKEREQLDSLIQSLLETHNVRIYEDRLAGEKGS